VPAYSRHGGRITIISTQIWARVYQGPNNSDQAFGIQIDGSNNICIIGQSRHAGNNADYLTLKYASDGRALWTNRYDGVAHGVDYGRLLATDAAGNVFVTGEERVFSIPTDVTTIKYSAQGLPVWTNRFNFAGTNQHTPSGFTADANGNVYLTVGTFGPVDPGYITLKYNSAGQPVWTNYFKAGPNSFDNAADVAVDRNGNVFVTGGSYGMVTIKYASDGSGLWTNVYSSQVVFGRELAVDDEENLLVLGENGVGGGITHVYVLVKYANDGIPLWTNVLTGPLYQGGNVPQLTVAPGGNVYLLGGSPSGNGNDVDFTVAKFSAGGHLLWTNRLFETNVGNPAPGRAAVDNTGNFYLPYSAGPDQTNRDFVIVKYGSDGTSLWTNRFNGPANSADYPAAAATDGMGAVYVTGYTKPPSGVWNCATVKFAEYIHYVPPPHFVGSDSFTFVATDASGTSATNVAAVNVRAESLWFNLSRSNFRLNEGGTPRLHLDGAGVDGTVVLYASPNLISWTPVATNAPLNDAVEFIVAPDGSRQFYRAVVISQ
jgi:hypothetical protein